MSNDVETLFFYRIRPHYQLNLTLQNEIINDYNVEIEWTVRQNSKQMFNVAATVRQHEQRFLA